MAQSGYLLQRAVAHHVVEQLTVGEANFLLTGHGEAHEAAQELREVAGICKVVFFTSAYRW